MLPTPLQLGRTAQALKGTRIGPPLKLEPHVSRRVTVALPSTAPWSLAQEAEAAIEAIQAFPDLVEALEAVHADLDEAHCGIAELREEHRDAARHVRAAIQLLDGTADPKAAAAIEELMRALEDLGAT